MKQKVRELLVTAKVAQNWNERFEQHIDELMDIVSKVDNEKKVQESVEVLDVYRKSKLKLKKNSRKKLADYDEKPFEFLVFRN